MYAADIDIIEACLRGDQDAWSQLIARYERLIYSIARTICREPEDCADVFQYVWLECHQQLERLRNIASLPAWLITVSRRRAFAVLRQKKSSVSLEEYDEPAVESDVAAIDREHAMERALDQLPERCRALLNLLYFDTSEPSYAVIAQRTGMPAASIGPTRARCLEKLKKFLD